ncbi:MAG: hypothetical protein ACK5OU_01330 [Dolichospermum sp.]
MSESECPRLKDKQDENSGFIPNYQLPITRYQLPITNYQSQLDN